MVLSADTQRRTGIDPASLRARQTMPAEPPPAAAPSAQNMEAQIKRLEKQINTATFNDSSGDTVLTTTLFGLGYGAIVGAFIAAVAMVASGGGLHLMNVLGAMGLFGGMGAISSRIVAGDRISAVRGSAVGVALNQPSPVEKGVDALSNFLGTVEEKAGVRSAADEYCDEHCQKERLFKFNRWLVSFAVGALIGIAFWAAAAVAPTESIAGPIMKGLGNLLGVQGKMLGVEIGPFLGATLLGGFTASTFGFNIPAIGEKIKAFGGRMFGRSHSQEPTQTPELAPPPREVEPKREIPTPTLEAPHPERNFSHVDAHKLRELLKERGEFRAMT